MEFGLLGSAVVAAAALYGGLRWTARGDAGLDVRELWDMAVVAAISGLAAGRFVAMVRGGVNPFTHPADVLLVRGGVDTVAASIVALAAATWQARPRLAGRLDALGPAAIAGLAGWHAGCVSREACLGTPSDLPWAWAQPGSAITRHPVELYAALALTVAFWGLSLLRRRGAPGLVASLALAVAGAARLATEPLRPSLRSDLVGWYGLAVGAGLLLASVAAIGPRASRRDGPHPPPLQ